MSKKDDEINRQLIFNSGGANPEDYLTPKQLQRYNENPERFIDIDVDLAMNQEDEVLKDPYESELKKAKEEEAKRIEEAKDDLTEGKIRRKRTEEEDPENNRLGSRLLDQIERPTTTNKQTAIIKFITL